MANLDYHFTENKKKTLEHKCINLYTNGWFIMFNGVNIRNQLTFGDIKLFFMYSSFSDFGRNLFGSFSENDPT